jgi:hypothetical protein
MYNANDVNDEYITILEALDKYREEPDVIHTIVSNRNVHTKRDSRNRILINREDLERVLRIKLHHLPPIYPGTLVSTGALTELFGVTRQRIGQLRRQGAFTGTLYNNSYYFDLWKVEDYKPGSRQRYIGSFGFPG